MSNIQKQLHKISYEFWGEQEEKGHITLWEHYITKGGFDINDFKQSLVKSPLFQHHVENVYSNKLDVLHLADIGPLFSEFWTSHEHNPVAWVDNDGIDGTIHTFITLSEQYFSKYSQIVKDLFAYELNGALPTNTQIKFYYEKNVKDIKYDIVSLTADIVAGLHNTNENAASLQIVNEQYDLKRIDATTHLNDNNKIMPFDIVRLTEFESVFQRAMYVQEYFKYINSTDLLQQQQQQQQQDSWEEIYNKHVEYFNRMRDIFEKYTGKTISEYYYVNRFLFSVDDPGFFDGIIDDIVSSPEYKSGMSKVLSDRYAAMYDVTMSESDTSFIFEIVKKQKLDIVNENIFGILTNLKDETDILIGSIFKIFARVLDRPPDMNEIDQYVAFFRNGHVESDLEEILMRTLEFHDSIKKIIRTEYFAIKGKEVIPSILYEILNRILVNLDNNMDKIHETIKNIIW